MSPSLEQELAAARKALRECEAARAEAERTSALRDEFLAIVSHELRSPLGAILGWAHMLRRRGSEEEFNRGLDVIEQSVHLQAKLIEDLVDMGRMASGQVRLDLRAVEPRGFIDAAAESVRPAAEEKRIRIDKVLDLSAGPILGDASRLQQVMVNLLANAVKFTPEEGHIRISVQRAGPVGRDPCRGQRHRDPSRFPAPCVRPFSPGGPDSRVTRAAGWAWA